MLVGTPIGNLGDITLRALETLRSVSLIAAEDTRVTRRLLTRYEIATRTTSYHARSGAAREEELPGPAGFLGPTPDVPHVLDSAVVEGPWIVGANRPDLHLGGVTIEGERMDVRTVEAGDTVNDPEILTRI